MDRAVQPRQRITADGRDHLTIQPTPAQPGRPVEHPGRQGPALSRTHPTTNSAESKSATHHRFVGGSRVKQTGRIDISVNVIGIGDIQKPLMDISVDEFIQPITTAMRTHFVTGKAAARHMIGHGSGVILTFGGSGPQTIPGLGGFKVALDAIAGLRRQWACELGQHGIRVVTLRTGGIPETIPDTFAGSDEIVAEIVRMTLLGRVATLDDVGNVAAFMASDQAGSVTDTEINISCGALVD